MCITQLDIAICAATPAFSAAWPWIIVALGAAALINSVLLAFWLSARSGELRSLTLYKLRNAIAAGERGTRRAANAQIESNMRPGSWNKNSFFAAQNHPGV